MSPTLVALLVGASVADHPASERTWTFTPTVQAGETLRLDLVRARVQRIDRAGTPTIAIRASGSSAYDVRPELRHDAAGWQIIDIYRRASLAPPHECLPTSNEHGHFAASDTVLDVTIAAPASLPVTLRIMDHRGRQGP